MLFNPKLLEKVQMFQSEEWINADVKSTPYDEIMVTFEGQKSFLGIKYNSTWKKSYTFNYKYTGIEEDVRMFQSNPDFKQLVNQLSDFVSMSHIEISRENYEYFKNLEPERFV